MMVESFLTIAALALGWLALSALPTRPVGNRRR
jgi:hypothetical protein